MAHFGMLIPMFYVIRPIDKVEDNLQMKPLKVMDWTHYRPNESNHEAKFAKAAKA